MFHAADFASARTFRVMAQPGNFDSRRRDFKA